MNKYIWDAVAIAIIALIAFMTMVALAGLVDVARNILINDHECKCEEMLIEE